MCRAYRARSLPGLEAAESDSEVKGSFWKTVDEFVAPATSGTNPVDALTLHWYPIHSKHPNISSYALDPTRLDKFSDVFRRFPQAADKGALRSLSFICSHIQSSSSISLIISISVSFSFFGGALSLSLSLPFSLSLSLLLLPFCLSRVLILIIIIGACVLVHVACVSICLFLCDFLCVCV